MTQNTKTIIDRDGLKQPITVGELKRALAGVRDDAIVCLDPIGNGPAYGFGVLKLATLRAIKPGEYRVEEKGERGIPAVLLAD